MIAPCKKIFHSLIFSIPGFCPVQKPAEDQAGEDLGLLADAQARVVVQNFPVFVEGLVGDSNPTPDLLAEITSVTRQSA